MLAAARLRHRIRRGKKLRIVVAGGLVLASMVQGGVAHAESPAVAQQVATFALPAAPLAETLKAIARISGKPVRAEGGLVEPLKASPVNGSLTALQALTMALAGTGLVANEAADGALSVGPVDLNRVVVVAQRDQAETSFKADRSDTTTRSGADLSEVPQSITIITSKVLETQQALSVRDALANVSGVAFTQSPQGSPSFSIRGFSDVSSTVNGLSNDSASLKNVFGVERIEVLKGPQAILAGADALGGAINVVTKKPEAAPIRSLLLQYGSHGDATVAGDLGGAITADKKLTYRLIAAKSQASSSAAGFDGRRDESLLPQLRWKDENTDFIVGVSYGKQREAPHRYTFARRDGAIIEAPSQLIGTRDDGIDTEQKEAFYQLEQKISNGIVFVSRFERSVDSLSLHLRSPFGLSYNRGAAPGSPNGKVTFSDSRSATDSRETGGDHYLRLEGDTGPVAHRLSVGVNHDDYFSKQTQYSGDSVQATIYPPGTPFEFPSLLATATDLAATSEVRARSVGVFAQDLMSWSDWSLLVNLRRTRYTTSSHTDLASGDTYDDGYSQWATTPGAGIVYSVVPGVSVYASYAQGFSPQNTPKCGGGLLPPYTTRNKEGGAKFDLLGSQLSLTTAVFELASFNQSVPNPDPDQNCSTVRAAQVTRGVEADMQGQLARGWNALANYTYTAVRDAGDSTTTYAGLAKHKMSVWTTYELQNLAWKGFGFGLGLTASAHVAGNTSAYPFTIPGQAQVDASVFYNRDKWNVTFGIKNVFDRLLYGVSGSSDYVPILEGRTFLLTVKRDFN